MAFGKGTRAEFVYSLRCSVVILSSRSVPSEEISTGQSFRKDREEDKIERKRKKKRKRERKKEREKGRKSPF